MSVARGDEWDEAEKKRDTIAECQKLPIVLSAVRSPEHDDGSCAVERDAHDTHDRTDAHELEPPREQLAYTVRGIFSGLKDDRVIDKVRHCEPQVCDGDVQRKPMRRAFLGNLRTIQKRPHDDEDGTWDRHPLTAERDIVDRIRHLEKQQSVGQAAFMIDLA